VRRLSWGRVIALCVVYIFIVNTFGVVKFQGRLQSQGEEFAAGPFMAVWLVCALGPPLLLALVYRRFRRRQPELQ